MRANKELSTRKSSLQVPEPTEMMLLTIILAAFLLLHVLAGTIVQRVGTGDGASSEPDVRSQLYD